MKRSTVQWMVGVLALLGALAGAAGAEQIRLAYEMDGRCCVADDTNRFCFWVGPGYERVVPKLYDTRVRLPSYDMVLAAPDRRTEVRYGAVKTSMRGVFSEGDLKERLQLFAYMRMGRDDKDAVSMRVMPPSEARRRNADVLVVAVYPVFGEAKAAGEYTMLFSRGGTLYFLSLVVNREGKDTPDLADFESAADRLAASASVLQ